MSIPTGKEPPKLPPNIVWPNDSKDEDVHPDDTLASIKFYEESNDKTKTFLRIEANGNLIFNVGTIREFTVLLEDFANIDYFIPPFLHTKSDEPFQPFFKREEGDDQPTERVRFKANGEMIFNPGTKDEYTLFPIKDSEELLEINVADAKFGFTPSQKLQIENLTPELGYYVLVSTQADHNPDWPWAVGFITRIQIDKDGTAVQVNNLDSYWPHFWYISHERGREIIANPTLLDKSTL